MLHLVTQVKPMCQWHVIIYPTSGTAVCTKCQLMTNFDTGVNMLMQRLLCDSVNSLAKLK